MLGSCESSVVSELAASASPGEMQILGPQPY